MPQGHRRPWHRAKARLLHDHLRLRPPTSVREPPRLRVPLADPDSLVAAQSPREEAAADVLRAEAAAGVQVAAAVAGVQTVAVAAGVSNS